MSRVSAFRPPVNGGVTAMAESILDERSAQERGHKAGLAAAASVVEATIHEIDGRWPQRSEAYEIARRAVSAYITQVQRAHGGTR